MVAARNSGDAVLAWKPGAEIAQSAFLDLPADVPLGDYELSGDFAETEQVIKQPRAIATRRAPAWSER